MPTPPTTWIFPLATQEAALLLVLFMSAIFSHFLSTNFSQLFSTWFPSHPPIQITIELEVIVLLRRQSIISNYNSSIL